MRLWLRTSGIEKIVNKNGSKAPGATPIYRSNIDGFAEMALRHTASTSTTEM